MAKLSRYRFINLEQASSSMPFLPKTFMAQVSTMKSKAATRSVSRIPHPNFDLLAASIASCARAIPW